MFSLDREIQYRVKDCIGTFRINRCLYVQLLHVDNSLEKKIKVFFSLCLLLIISLKIFGRD